jgi:crossover junction endodeoxyribonuclease RusA
MPDASIFLPWPDKRLSPNARQHWASLARAKKAAKRAAYYTALEAGLGKIEAETISVRVSFFPPDRRPRDTDNAFASCKAAFDGIAQAIGIDDSKWNITIAPRGPVEKSGMVKVDLEWEEA